jgi:Rho-related BTB domain-containing protein 1/2
MGRLLKLMTSDLLELIELANRLCLPRIQALAEEMIICQLTTMVTAGQEIFEEVAGLLEPAQVGKIQ